MPQIYNSFFGGYLGIHTGAELQTYANTSLCILMGNLSINADVALQRIVHASFWMSQLLAVK